MRLKVLEPLWINWVWEGRKVNEWPTPSAGELIRAMEDAGFDIGDNLIKQTSPEMIEWVDKIIIMAQKELVSKELLGNKKSVWWDVQDGTDYSDYEFFASSIKEIKARVVKLIGELGG